MPQRELSKEEFQDWKDHPVTLKFFRVMAEVREDALQALANGVYADEPGKQNILIGKINALTKVLETKFGEDGIHD